MSAGLMNSNCSSCRFDVPVWSHLPNAKHIDAVMASVKANPEAWHIAWHTARNVVSWAAREAARDAGREAARDAGRDAELGAVWLAFRDDEWDAAWNGMLAFVAYDHASKYLQMTPDQLRAWALLSEDPAAVLLIPAAIAFDKLADMEVA